MKTRLWNACLSVLFFVGVSVVSAGAETIELVTYYPASNNSGNLHGDSLTVGPDYANVVPGDGVALISNQLGIGTTAPVAGSRLDVVGVDGQPSSVLFVPGTGAGSEIRMGIGTINPAGVLHVVGADDAVSNVVFMPGADTAAPGTPEIRVGIGTTNPVRKLDVRGHLVLNTDPASPFEPGGELVLANGDPLATPTWHVDNTADRFRIFRQPNINTAGPEFFTITNTGWVGIGTSDPKSMMNVHNAASQGSIHISGVSDSGRTYSALYLDDATAGDARNTWVLAFKNEQGTASQDAFHIARYRADGTAFVPVVIQPDGKVGIGTTTPAVRLDVIGGIRFGRPDNSSSDGGLLYTSLGNFGSGALRGKEVVLTVSDGHGGANDEIWIGPNTGSANGNINLVAHDVWCTGTPHSFSDIRMKTDIAVIPNALERICSLRGVNFHWKDSGEKPALEMGVIGQEVEAVFPELVRTNPKGMKFVSYNSMNGALIEAIKELKSENQRLSERLALVEDQLKTRTTPPAGQSRGGPYSR